MAKQKNIITPEEQRERFEAEVRKRIAAGELSPIDAEAAIDRLLRDSSIRPETKTPPG